MKVWGRDSWLFNHHSFISSLYKYLLRASYWKFLVIKQWTVSPFRLTPKNLSDCFYFLSSPTVTILIPSFFAASILFSHRHIWETVCGNPSKIQSCGSFLRAFDISYHSQNIGPFHALDSILLSLASILVFTVGNSFALTVPCMLCPWHRQPSCFVNTIDSSKSCFYITSFAKTSLKYTLRINNSFVPLCAKVYHCNVVLPLLWSFCSFLSLLQSFSQTENLAYKSL